MCFKGRSRFCLFCILLYSFLPHGSIETSAENPDATTYTALKDAADPQLSKLDEEVYQLRERTEQLDMNYSIAQLMTVYGNGSVMTFEGFEHLLLKLGLGKIVIFDHSVQCHKANNDSNFKSFHLTHNHSQIVVGSGSILCGDGENVHKLVDNRATGDEHVDVDTLHHHDETEKAVTETVDAVHDHEEQESTTKTSQSKRHEDQSTTDKCLSAHMFLKTGKKVDSQIITKDLFHEICPSLIYQITEDACHNHHTDHSNSHGDDLASLHGDKENDHSHGGQSVAKQGGLSGVPAKVWGFSSIAVLIISLVGLLAVAVIPIMQKVFYNHLLQFLVALAVGALSGDALLHLLPHAIAENHSSEQHFDDHSSHDKTVYKGLCGLVGIYFFYIVERVLTIVTDMKRRKKQSRNRKMMGDVQMDKIGEKLAADCGEMMMSVHPNKDCNGDEVTEIFVGPAEALQGYADEAHSEHCTISFENTSAISHQHGKHKHSHNAEEEVDMLSHSKGHGHGHGHSHCTDGAPNSIAAIAWMVILGDGIHNFSDGLAIGAAFSNSITGGFSTSIAVFCHELPHEIGDFAMLLRAGMGPKQAIIYNCLSSVLCFIGMPIGVAIGNIENASLWIFAIVGGMFLYIALVDMLPEMSSLDPKLGEHPFCHLALQLLGMLLGGSIMLVIALYEDSLKSILE